jgi:hypothetical protein
MMITFFLCLITVIPTSKAVGVFWLVVSCVTYLPTCTCLATVRSSPRAVHLDTEDGDQPDVLPEADDASSLGLDHHPADLHSVLSHRIYMEERSARQ